MQQIHQGYGMVFRARTLPLPCFMFPSASVEAYRQAFGWRDFLYVLALESTGTTKLAETCAAPTITYKDGTLKFESATAGAQYHYHYTLTCPGVATPGYSEDGNVELQAVFQNFLPTPRLTVTRHRRLARAHSIG